MDFLMISTKSVKKDLTEIYPKFIIKKSSDLMIRGGDFYAIWDEERGVWSTDEQDVIRLVDIEIDNYVKKNKQFFTSNISIQHMWDSDTGVIDRWHKYCQKQMRDNFHMLDETLVFSNSDIKKTDYASKRLSYPLEPGSINAYDTLMSTLYSEEERRKIEWAIGSIITGDSKKIQKFMVLYGSAGTGKSTILNIIQQLFEGYYSVFDAKALGSATNAFALESFKDNPLVAIQHDGDLSRIEDNTRLNSLVSHELMTVNEKFKATYANRFKAFLFMGTNKPVRITDAKSGLIRRLIDVSPTGKKVSAKDYKKLVKQIEFELGAIACHCRDVYLENPGYYDGYVPISMLGASNDFYNFIEDSYYVFKKENGTTLKAAWEMYKQYCDDAKVPYPLAQRAFKEELKNYFKDYKERYMLQDGSRVRSYFEGFCTDKFETVEVVEEKHATNWIEFDCTESIFDKECADCIAQYATSKDTPTKKWDEVKTTLKDIDTTKVHFVKVPETHIVIDFDIPDENGNKSLERNLIEASKWPVTYAELSKSGQGIHLHYIYTGGDVSKLSAIYDDHIEVKVFFGKTSLRRKLTKCNNKPIANISSGLPLKGEKPVVNFDSAVNEKAIRTMIKKNLNKEYHAATKPSIDFIDKILTDAYNNGTHYDVTDLRPAILAFAANSSNQSAYCISLVNNMKFKSEEISDNVLNEEEPIVFYDIEVFPNLFLVNWKYQGEDKSVNRMINPNPTEVEALLKYRLIGFNCRRYDNHITYARLMGYTNEQLFELSQRIISGSRNAFFGEAYNISYTDVYDFASAGNKKSLKKFEIELINMANDPTSKLSDDLRRKIKKIKHHELGLPWDQPVAEELWPTVAEYCDDDVLATEVTFEYLSADWTARQILADLAESSVNDTTNTLTTRIIFGKERNPQNEFEYRDMSMPVNSIDEPVLNFLQEACPKMMAKRHGPDNSFLPYFPGYKFEYGKSSYRGEEFGEGGYVYTEPGIYTNVALLDIASMHPHSLIAECLFGVRFTKAFRDIVEGRVSIKHQAWDVVSEMLDGKLKPYIQKVIDGEMTSKQLANALKTAINSVYGLTSASFPNAFRDPNNKDNIVAKRGELFMIDLKHAVQDLGFTVAHIKTDSIKIPNATPEIIKFVMDFGERYGYTFEHEATYDRMCLVNKAVYIAKFATPEKCMSLYGYVPDECNDEGGEWTATGTQFAIPYVFKTLFSKEPITFSDFCEIKSVQALMYIDTNETLPDVSLYEKEYKARHSKAKNVKLNTQFADWSDEQLLEEIAKGHDYHFVGKIGQFTPVKPNTGGGLLVWEKGGKYHSVTGTDGYRWYESETIKNSENYDIIDKTYYINLVDDAKDTISKYGDFELFVSDEEYICEDLTPPWEVEYPTE